MSDKRDLIQISENVLFRKPKAKGKRGKVIMLIDDNERALTTFKDQVVQLQEQVNDLAALVSRKDKELVQARALIRIYATKADELEQQLRVENKHKSCPDAAAEIKTLKYKLVECCSGHKCDI